MMSELEVLIREYDDVYLVGEGINLSLLARVSESSEKRDLFLVSENPYSESEAAVLNTYKMLKDSEYNQIRNLYGTYEFSDNFHLLSSDDKNYGCIMNLVKTGILSEGEAYKAMLGLRA